MTVVEDPNLSSLGGHVGWGEVAEFPGAEQGPQRKAHAQGAAASVIESIHSTGGRGDLINPPNLIKDA